MDNDIVQLAKNFSFRFRYVLILLGVGVVAAVLLGTVWFSKKLQNEAKERQAAEISRIEAAEKAQRFAEEQKRRAEQQRIDEQARLQAEEIRRREAAEKILQLAKERERQAEQKQIEQQTQLQEAEIRRQVEESRRKKEAAEKAQRLGEEHERLMEEQRLEHQAQLQESERKRQAEELRRKLTESEDRLRFRRSILNLGTSLNSETSTDVAFVRNLSAVVDASLGSGFSAWISKHASVTEKDLFQGDFKNSSYFKALFAKDGRILNEVQTSEFVDIVVAMTEHTSSAPGVQNPATEHASITLEIVAWNVSSGSLLKSFSVSSTGEGFTRNAAIQECATRAAALLPKRLEEELTPFLK